MTDATTRRDDHLRRTAVWSRKIREAPDDDFARRAARVAMHHWRMALLFQREMTHDERSI